MSIRQPLGSLVHENMSTPTEIMSQPPQSQTVTQPLLTPLKDKEGHATTATAQTMHTTTMNKLNTNDTTAKPPASPLMVKSHPQSQTALAETPLRPRDHMTESRSAMRFHTSASTGMRSVRHDENNQMMPPYPMSVGREQTHPPRHSHSHALGHGHGSAHLHRHPQPLPPPRFSPYPYSPTPNMTSGYHHASSPHHPQSVHADRSHGRYPVSHGPPSHAQSGPHRNHAFVSTPTPSSRSYRSDATNPNMTPSYGSAGSATPASIYTPLAYPLSPTSSSSGELVMLPRPRGSPLKLHGLEPAATWTDDAPPHLWLAGEKGDVAAPCSMTDPQEKEWKKLVAYTKNFKSHNPWDYGIKENREHFNDNHKKYLELQWILDSNPSTTARERLGAWLGVATRRITVFYQNRRQMMSKTKPTAAADRSRRGSSSTATDAGVFGEMMMSGRKTTQSTPMHGHGTVGPVRLNTNRGLLDDNWKWTPSTSSSPLPPPDREVINQLAIVYAIITGELDEYCYHHYYITNRVRQVSGTSSSPTLMSDDSSYDDVQVPAIHYPVGQTRRLEDIMQEREAELPIRRKSPPGPQYDERGSIVNLPAMLPTDIPSEDIDPDHLDQHQSHANKRHGSRSQRGERVPDFAMRTETTIAGARASAVNLYHCSNRAKELAKRRGSSLSASGSPLPRTQSLPSIGHPLSGAALPSLANVIAGSTNSSSSGNSAVSRPKLQARGVRQSYPSLKPIINTKPQNSWTRSHSALDLPTLSRYPGGSRSQSHSRAGSEVASDTVIEEEDEKRPGGGEMDMSEAAELLMGMSRATDSTSGSGSGGSQ